MDHLHRPSYVTPEVHLHRRLDQAKADAAETQHIAPELRTWQQAARNRIRNNGRRYQHFDQWSWERENGERWIGFQVKTERNNHNNATSWPVYIVDITYADEHSHTSHFGWYRDDYQDSTYRGCAVYIRGAGWLPGYMDAESETIQCDLSQIGDYPEYGDEYNDSRDDRREAARAGDELARIDAEFDREYNEAYEAARRLTDELQDEEQSAEDAIGNAAALIPARNTGEPCTRRAIRAALTESIRAYRGAIERTEELRGELDEAKDNFRRITGGSFSL